jgi:hypothetical protein
MIYRVYFIAISCHGQNFHPEPPNLLAAVHCRPDLYPEAVDFYRHEYKFTLWYKNKKDFRNNVSMGLVRSIRHLTISHRGMQQTLPHENGDFSQAFGFPDSRSLRRYLDFGNFTERTEWARSSLCENTSSHESPKSHLYSTIAVFIHSTRPARICRLDVQLLSPPEGTYGLCCRTAA